MEQTLQPYSKGGITFQVRPGTSDVKGVDEVMGGGYRRTRPFRFDVDEGDRWIDLGAMVGAFSAYAASRGARRVVAVEPDPDHVRILKLNAPEAEVVHAAVVTDASLHSVTLNRNDKRGNTWRNSIMRTWQGGSTVEVPAVHISSLIDSVGSQELCIKMDIEGMEMPILEWLIEHPEQLRRVKKLAFEWSFDVDDDLNRFRHVMKTLIAAFPNVAPVKLYEGESNWPKSWFPACTTIFCSRV